MKRYKCNRCEETWAESEIAINTITVANYTYCIHCYVEIYGEVLFNLFKAHGLLPTFIIHTDECEECKGKGQIEHSGSHSWFEECEKCGGTGKINASHTA